MARKGLDLDTQLKGEPGGRENETSGSLAGKRRECDAAMLAHQPGGGRSVDRAAFPLARAG